jgi:hypothetical protein
MPLITTVSELREFVRDATSNPSGLDPADIVAVERRPCGNLVHLPTYPPDEAVLLLYGVVMEADGQPGRGLVSALKAWRGQRGYPHATVLSS